MPIVYAAMAYAIIHGNFANVNPKYGLFFCGAVMCASYIGTFPGIHRNTQFGKDMPLITDKNNLSMPVDKNDFNNPATKNNLNIHDPKRE